MNARIGTLFGWRHRRSRTCVVRCRREGSAGGHVGMGSPNCNWEPQLNRVVVAWVHEHYGPYAQDRSARQRSSAHFFISLTFRLMNSGRGKHGKTPYAGLLRYPTYAHRRPSRCRSNHHAGVSRSSVPREATFAAIRLKYALRRCRQRCSDRDSVQAPNREFQFRRASRALVHVVDRD